MLRFINHGTADERTRATQLLTAILEQTSESNRTSVAQQSRGLFESVLKDEVKYGSEMYWLLARLSQSYGEADRERLLRRIANLGDASPRFGVERFLDPDGILRNLLHLESTNDAPKVGAAMLFRENPVKPERVVPLLTSALRSKNRALLERSAQALAAYGAHSKPALPVLSNLVTHPRPAVAKAARDAIATISVAE